MSYESAQGGRPAGSRGPDDSMPEQWHELMFEAAPIPKALVGLDGRWLEVNPALVDLLGYDRERLLSLRFQDVTHPDDLDKDLALLGQLMADEIPSYSMEKRYLRSGGSTVWVELHVSAVRAGDGRIRYFVAQIIDIDSRHRLEEERAQANRRLEQLATSLRAALHESRLERARYKALVDHLPDTAVYIYDSDARIRVAEGSGIARRGLDPSTLIGCRMADLMLPSDLEQLGPLLDAALHGSPSTVDIRMETTEMENLVDLIPVERPDGDREALVMARDIGALRERDRALALSEARFRAVYEHAPVAVIEEAGDGTVVGGNEAAARLLGRPVDRLVGTDWRRMIHAEDRPDEDPRATDRPQLRSECRVVRDDGSTVWVSVRVSPLPAGPDSAPGLVVHLVDVTAERLQRDEIDAMSARFAALVEHGTDAITVLDADLVLTYASPSYEKVFGYRPDDNVGTEAARRVHPDDRATFRSAIAGLLEGRQAVARYQVRVLHSDGGWRWIEVTASNHLDDPATAGIVCNVRDVTERVRSTEALEYLASHDILTGLANRARFGEALDAAVTSHRRGGPPCAVLYLDLDRFKATNDTLGHSVGDQVLVEVAGRLTAAVRPGDVVGRLGGDEFVILAIDVATPRTAAAMAERIAASLGVPLRIDGREVSTGCSIGIALSGHLGGAAMLQAADRALYRAKGQGSPRWCVSPSGRPAASFESQPA